MKNLLILLTLFSFQVFTQGYPLPANSRKKIAPSKRTLAMKKLESLRAKLDSKKLYKLLGDIEAKQHCFGPSDDLTQTKKIAALICTKTMIKSEVDYQCHLNKSLDHKEIYDFISNHDQSIKSFRKVRLPGNTITCEMSVSYGSPKSYKCYTGGQKVNINSGI